MRLGYMSLALIGGVIGAELPSAAQPVVAAQTGAPLPSIVAEKTLPANTQITVRMNDELSSKKNREGDTFYMSVTNDVMVDGYVAIPRGSRAVGTITWMTKKGAFGKSGKMDISINAIEVGESRVPVVGTFRQEGKGNTAATVGAVVAVGVFSAFVTGHSAVIPQGRELIVHTRDPLKIGIPAGVQPRTTTAIVQ